jgi:hypothetical protein
MVHKFWLEEPLTLFIDTCIIPSPDMELSVQMNSATRLVILASIISMAAGAKTQTVSAFLGGSIVFIIILYYVQRSAMDKNRSEHFTQDKHTRLDSKFAINPKGAEDVRPNGDAFHPAKTDYYRHSHEHPMQLPGNMLGGDSCTIDIVGKSDVIGRTPLNTDGNIETENGAVFRSYKQTSCVRHDTNGVSFIDGSSRNYTGSKPIKVNDPGYSFASKKISGGANPKTLIQPIIAPPITDIEYWRDNELIERSGINTASQFDTYLSGYNVSNFEDDPTGYCDASRGPIGDQCHPPRRLRGVQPGPLGPGPYMESYTGPPRHPEVGPAYPGVTSDGFPIKEMDRGVQRRIISPQPSVDTAMLDISVLSGGCCHGVAPKQTKAKPEVFEDYMGPPIPYEIVSPQPSIDNFYSRNSESTLGPRRIREGYSEVANAVPFDARQITRRHPRDPASGDVNTSCGYNPDQLFNSNNPTNLGVGACNRSKDLSQYNKNLFTSTIQPGVYSRAQTVKPIQSNMGISFTQGLDPVTSHFDPGNGTTYTEHDPRLYEEPLVYEEPRVTESNVYDGRLTGSGPTGRGYQDKLTGASKFYADDINSVRMPNYIVRSNIDFARYANSYGPMTDENKNGIGNIREMANRTFMESAIAHRTGLQQSLMSKRNGELYNTRQFPTHTRGTR